jgi:hypothetical protein
MTSPAYLRETFLNDFATSTSSDGRMTTTIREGKRVRRLRTTVDPTSWESVMAATTRLGNAVKAIKARRAHTCGPDSVVTTGAPVLPGDFDPADLLKLTLALRAMTAVVVCIARLEVAIEAYWTRCTPAMLTPLDLVRRSRRETTALPARAP